MELIRHVQRSTPSQLYHRERTDGRTLVFQRARWPFVGLSSTSVRARVAMGLRIVIGVIVPTVGMLLTWRFAPTRFWFFTAFSIASLAWQIVEHRRVPRYVVLDARAQELRLPGTTIPFSKIIRVERSRVRDSDESVVTWVRLIVRGRPPLMLGAFSAPSEAEALAHEIEELVYGAR